MYKSAQKSIGLESYLSETLDCIQFNEAHLVETVLGYDFNCPYLFVFSYLSLSHLTVQNTYMFYILKSQKLL